MKAIYSIFKTFVLSLAMIANIHFAFAQTQQGIIPNARSTYFDNNGNPVSSGTVDYYIPGTSTRKTTYKDIDGTIPNTNPVVLDAAGRALIWGNGSYRQVVKDSQGNQIWDAVTLVPTSSGGGSALVGDGNTVGTILPWPGISPLPNNYLYAYGQEVSRSTYATLLQTISITQTVTCTGGSPLLTNVPDTSQITVGTKVEASCLLTTGTVISKTGSSITLNTNANITTGISAVFYPWGNGDAATTFNLPDLRGVTLIGRCNMGGVNCSNITSAFYSVDPNGLNASGGNQSSQLVTANLPPYTPAGTISVTNGAISITSSTPSPNNAFIPINGGSTISNSSPGGAFGTNGSLIATQDPTTASFTGTAQGGSSAQFSIIQPSKTINYIIKVTGSPSLVIARCSDLIDSGTACTANTGTSGHTLPFLDTANSWSANQTMVSFQISGNAAVLAGNPLSATGPMGDFTIQGLTQKIPPDANNDFLLLWDSATNSFKKVSPGQVGSIGVSGVSSLGGMTGALTCGTGLTCASSNVAANKALYGFTVPGPLSSSANLPSSFIQAVTPMQTTGTSGPGSVTMSIRPAALWHLITVSGTANTNTAYVDPVNGTDASFGNICTTPATACKTLQYCFQNCSATNIVGIPTGPFNPFTYDASATLNLWHRLTFQGEATIKLNGSPYIDTSAMTFTPDGVQPVIYKATLGLTGAQAVQRVTKNNVFDTGNGNPFRLMQYSSLAALRTAVGTVPNLTAWAYDGAGNLYITYAGSNVDAAKTSFTVYYLDSNGQSRIQAIGNVNLLIDTPYQLNLDGVSVIGSSSDASHHPTILIDGRKSMLVRSFVSPEFGTQMNGGFLYVDGFDCQASRYDCWNGNPPSAGTDISVLIGSNIRGWYAGDAETYSILGLVYNNQGWSTHGGSNDIIAGASFGRNVGQNVANISNSNYASYSWLVGVETYKAVPPPASFSPGYNFVVTDGSSATRTVWMDTNTSAEETNSLYVQTNSTVYVTNNAFNVPQQTNAGGVINNYVRNAP